MTIMFTAFFGLVALLLILLLWVIRKPRENARAQLGPLEENGHRHVTYLPQVRQALAPADYEYLFNRASPRLARRVRLERSRIALSYLSALREDFQKLLRLARIIAVLSPEVVAVQEFERLRLTVKFTWRCQMIRLRLLSGFAPAPQLRSLSDMVSGLNVRIEMAMKELGERAALLPNSLHRSTGAA